MVINNAEYYLGFLILVKNFKNVSGVFGLTFIVNLQSKHRHIKLEEQFIMVNDTLL